MGPRHRRAAGVVPRLRPAAELLGCGIFAEGQVESWLGWCANELEVPITQWLFPVLGLMEFDGASYKDVRADVFNALKLLNGHLESATFVVGERLTLADIAIASVLVYPMRMLFDGSVRKSYPHLTRWFATCAAMPAFVSAIGTEPLCQFAKKAKGKKKAGAAKQGKTKKEKKAAAAKAAANKPKKKKSGRIVHRLDALPKSKLGFSMMGWKSVFANSKKNPFQAMEWFWAHFDDSIFSIWFQKFKHNDENVSWMVSNQLAGFTQRTDGLRKWAMGSFTAMDTLAAKGCYEVEGVWVFKGTDMQEMIEQNPEAALYNWTKLTPAMLADPAVRQRVNNFWAGEGHDGVRWYQSNYFY